ncbi:MAG: ATP-dependent RecD-like DNA helicase [Deltaproteobacteria bacterium]|nr:ATP-dependent RecD-like DNA helicase [Deltaproteobacteria bacterium]
MPKRSIQQTLFSSSATEPAAEIQGQIDRITFYNEENGYIVAKLKVHGQKELVTVVGNLPGTYAGEVLKLWGEWSTHPRFGLQFKITRFQSVMPATAAGIEKYLGSGLIKGVGPVMANRLVRKFGTDALEIIENEPQRLQEVEGIGPKRVQMIKDAWDAQKEIREVMIFLQGHGVSSAYATKIFKQYGRQAIGIVKESPYQLAADITGIGFITADKIARNLGFAKDSPARLAAGSLYVLYQLTADGHAYYPYEALVQKSQEILGVEREGIIQAFARLAEDRQIIWEDRNDAALIGEGEFQENNKAVYLAGYHAAEVGIAKKIRELLTRPSVLRPIQGEKAMEWVQNRLAIELAEKQSEAVQTALQNKVMVLTGGPGTGKTTIIKAVLEVYRQVTPRILLAAPTGRAAKRMSEATGWEAKTIHRLLEWNFEKGGFKRDESFPLDADVVIIDETSMIDTLLMFHLLKAIPSGAILLLVGDVDQLPSVGAGTVLRDIIQSGAVPVVRLTEIFRQAMGSWIIMNAHRINRGEFPRIDSATEDPRQDFFFIEKQEAEDVLGVILEWVTQKIPARFGLHPLRDIQVLTPMHKGILGTGNLNQVLQEALNPSGTILTRGGRTYREGDKVMQIANDYEREVFNGGIGRIAQIDFENQVMKVDFDGRVVPYDYPDLDELVLAYAISIHKSQGSEYPAVVMPMHTTHYIMLQRNLIYTGITRAKQLAVVVGTKKALNIGIRNDKTKKRYTGLQEKLRTA